MAASKEEVKDTGVPTNDAYTGMLVISLVALIAGSALLYLDWSQYPPAPAPKALPKYEKPAAVAPVAPAPPDDKKGPALAPPPGKDAPPAPAKDAPPMPEAKK